LKLGIMTNIRWSSIQSYISFLPVFQIIERFGFFRIFSHSFLCIFNHFLRYSILIAAILIDLCIYGYKESPYFKKLGQIFLCGFTCHSSKQKLFNSRIIGGCPVLPHEFEQSLPEIRFVSATMIVIP